MATITSITSNMLTLNIGDLAPKSFSTGSKGWFSSEKLVTDDGDTYQCNFMAVIPGSKDDASIAIPTAPLHIGTLSLGKKDFSSGSKGYFVNGRVITEQGVVQLQLQAVLVGSKPVDAKVIDKQEQLLAREKAQYEKRLATIAAMKATLPVQN